MVLHFGLLSLIARECRRAVCLAGGLIAATAPLNLAAGAGGEIHLAGVVRDFRADHADFNAVPFGGYGHYAGTVSVGLRSDGRPQFVPGMGYRVDDEWRDDDDHPIAPHLYVAGNPLDACGNAIDDEPGVRGPASSGGITSAATFNEWFRDVPGTNLSTVHTITLTRNGAGVWRYLDDAFHPIDNRSYGNEGEPHNHHFTYAIRAEFVYRACWVQFVEFEGGDGAWVFIDGRLVVDLGGVAPDERQRVALDRLGLVDGETYVLDLFYAQRRSGDTPFRLMTTLELSTVNRTPTVSAMFD